MASLRKERRVLRNELSSTKRNELSSTNGGRGDGGERLVMLFRENSDRASDTFNLLAAAFQVENLPNIDF